MAVDRAKKINFLSFLWIIGGLTLTAHAQTEIDPEAIKVEMDSNLRPGHCSIEPHLNEGVLCDRAHLRKDRHLIKESDVEIPSPLGLLIKDANQCLDQEGACPALSVTQAPPHLCKDTDPTHPCSDPHNLYQMVNYGWPHACPGTPGFKEIDKTNPPDLNANWVYCDGAENDASVNPQKYTGYPNGISLMDITRKNVENLSTAYAITGKQKYASKASDLMRTWFLDPKTKMNPNFAFAQAFPNEAYVQCNSQSDIKQHCDQVYKNGTVLKDGGTCQNGIDSSTGKSNSACTGYAASKTDGAPIYGNELIQFLDSEKMLEGSKTWKKSDTEGFKSWMKQYLSWLDGPMGQHEFVLGNNHASWYLTQKAAILTYLGDPASMKAAKSVVEQAKTLINTQIWSNGAMPYELERTRPLQYSFFNLDALTKIAELGKKVGVDLWNYQGTQGGSLKKAMDYMAPCVTKVNTNCPVPLDQKFSQAELASFKPRPLFPPPAQPNMGANHQFTYHAPEPLESPESEDAKKGITDTSSANIVDFKLTQALPIYMRGQGEFGKKYQKDLEQELETRTENLHHVATDFCEPGG